MCHLHTNKRRDITITLQSSPRGITWHCQLTHGAIGGEVGLNGGCVILWNPLIVAGRHPKRWSSIGPQGEVDHCPAAEKRKQEQCQCEEQTPWLTEKTASTAGVGGEGGSGLLCLSSQSLGGGTVQGFSRSRHWDFLIPFHFGRLPFFLCLLMHAPPLSPA